MERTERLEDFYQHKLNWMPDNLKKEIGHFNVFRIDDFVGCNARPIPYSRKDFFKISFLVGRNRMHYADKVVEIDRQGLLFANPHIPYAWEPLQEEQTGYFCIFTSAFFDQFGALKDYPVFQPGGTPVFLLTDVQAGHVGRLFERMLEEIDSEFAYKYDVLRTLVFELVHTALKLQPAATSLYHAANAATRISSLFMELLERQFPIESPRRQVVFRAPTDFASQLAVHVNHLNRALKETTGKTTSQIIAERVTQEARTLLRHTDWNVSEIAWCLGFEEAAHFINFFKKNVQLTPRSYRNLEAV
ncbi:helix-turn-helix domain-containing protein [Larkinella soli]|uniref:helix-turn-helix domain-containing protein n=1 Tax=Larkinella soli TaxID=1770527 RepID=UPI000FFB1658|nr:AraC family transcriptional regulator [Larkinella soli]